MATTGTIEPYDYQKADIKRLRENNYRALLNMGTGSGKTFTSLFAVQEAAPDRTLIIAPLQTHESAWLSSLNALGMEGRVIGNTRKAEKEAMFDFELGEPGIYLVSPGLFTRSDVSLWSGDMLIVDEAHKLGNPGKAGQRKLGGYNRKDDPIAPRFEGRLMLSGTPLRNKFEFAWSHGRALWPELNSPGGVADVDFFRWRNSRMTSKEIFIGMRWVPCRVDVYNSLRNTPKKYIDGVPHYGERKTAKEFGHEAIPGRWLSQAPCIITHLKREQCCEYHPNGYLPLNEPLVKREVISLAPAQKKAIKELDKIMITYLEDNPLEAKIPLDQVTRIRQCILGVPTLVEDEETLELKVEFETDCVSPFFNRLEDILVNEVPDENVVVYVDSQKFAAVVTERLNESGIPAFEYSGQTRSERDEKAALFGSEYRVAVGVLSAIAEGYDGLQRVAKTEVWLSRSLDETLNEQAQGRLDRIGQKDQVLRFLLEDDLGITGGRYSEAVEKRLELNKSLRAGV